MGSCAVGTDECMQIILRAGQHMTAWFVMTQVYILLYAFLYYAVDFTLVKAMFEVLSNRLTGIM